MRKNINFQIVKHYFLDNQFLGIKMNWKKRLIEVCYRQGNTHGFEFSEELLDCVVKEILKKPVISNLSLSKPLSNRNGNRLLICAVDYFTKKYN